MLTSTFYEQCLSLAALLPRCTVLVVNADYVEVWELYASYEYVGEQKKTGRFFNASSYNYAYLQKLRTSKIFKISFAYHTMFQHKHNGYNYQDEMSYSDRDKSHTNHS